MEALYAAAGMLNLHRTRKLPILISETFRLLSQMRIGIVEAPRGTLIHHYKTDKNGIITEANLIVATVNNAAAIGVYRKSRKGSDKRGNLTVSPL
jgi:F420-non-reducing hydrogenase large subunit